jgi:hypothetical protein
MSAAAHQNRDTFSRSYDTSESRVDGQNTFLGNEGREDPSAAFLEQSVPYTPNLAQRLPAEERYKLESSEKYVKIEEDIASAWDDKTIKSKDLIKKLQRKRNALIDDALKYWQKNQPYKPEDPPFYHYGIFDRCRFMMPERDRLAINVFKSANLRSSIGLSVLRDLVALLSKNTEVEFRPGLEREKCACTKVKREFQDDNIAKVPGKYDWRHIYNCYKKKSSAERGFAELCFKCNEWIFSEHGWIGRCATDLKDIDSFSIYFDPLIYSGVLATPGYCPFCLRNEKLPPTCRMYQYLNRDKWLTHIQEQHMEILEKSERERGITATCPHPHPNCPMSFPSVLHLKFHLEDVHGIPLTKRPNVNRKRPASQREQVQTPPEKLCKSEHGSFNNLTMAGMDTRTRRASKIRSSRTSTRSSPENTLLGSNLLPPLVPFTNPTANFDPIKDLNQVSDTALNLTDFDLVQQQKLLDADSSVDYSGRSTPYSNSNNTRSSCITPSSSLYDFESLNDHEDLGTSRHEILGSHGQRNSAVVGGGSVEGSSAGPASISWNGDWIDLTDSITGSAIVWNGAKNSGSSTPLSGPTALAFGVDEAVQPPILDPMLTSGPSSCDSGGGNITMEEPSRNRPSTWSEKKGPGSETPTSSGTSDAKDDLASDLDFVVIDELDTSILPSHNHQVRSVDVTWQGEEIWEIIQHTTIETEYDTVNSSPKTSNRSTPSCSDSTQLGSDSASGYDTPLSFAFSEDLIDQAISPLNDLDLGGIQVVDLTELDDVTQSSTYTLEASESAY